MVMRLPGGLLDLMKAGFGAGGTANPVAPPAGVTAVDRHILRHDHGQGRLGMANSTVRTLRMTSGYDRCR